MTEKKKLRNFENIFSELGIKKNDKILINSDIRNLLINFKKKKIRFDPNLILDKILKRIGSQGTLLIPTFNWGFCNGANYDPINSQSSSGSLSRLALKRKKFQRTLNPIYSFAVTGKDKNKIYRIKHQNCFDMISPFGYMIKNKAKNLFIGIDYKEAFTFVHVAEQKVGVSYRYLKEFKGKIVDAKKKKNKIKCTMYVRNLNFNGVTAISKKLDNILKKKKYIKRTKFNGVNFSIIDIAKTYGVIEKDLLRGGKLVYPKKIQKYV